MLGLSIWHLSLDVYRNPHPQDQALLSYLCSLRAPDCAHVRKAGTEPWHDQAEPGRTT